MVSSSPEVLSVLVIFVLAVGLVHLEGSGAGGAFPPSLFASPHLVDLGQGWRTPDLAVAWRGPESPDLEGGRDRCAP